MDYTNELKTLFDKEYGQDSLAPSPAGAIDYTAELQTLFSEPVESVEEGSSLGAFARTALRVPENLAAKTIMAVQGQAGASVADRGVADRFVNWVEDRNQKLAQEYEGTGDFIPGVISKRDVAELGPNLAFSGISMGGTIAGGLAAAPVPVPGARIVGAMAGGATAAHRMDTYQVMNDWLEKVNQESIDAGLGPISKPEEEKFKKDMSALATEHGLWEAGPEGFANVLQIALLTAKNIPGVRWLPKGVVGKLAKGGLRFAGVAGTEELTETPTQMGQQIVESKAGMTAEAPRKWTSGGDILKSAKEVLPQVLLLSGFMSTGGAAYRGATKTKEAIKPDVSAQSPPLEAFRDKFAKGELTAQELETAKAIWSDNAEFVSGIDEILKPVMPEVAPKIVTPEKIEPTLPTEPIAEMPVEPAPTAPKTDLALEPVGAEKKPVEFIGMQERVNKLPIPFVNELDTKSTVAYDPAKHEMTNLPEYEKAIERPKIVPETEPRAGKEPIGTERVAPVEGKVAPESVADVLNSMNPTGGIFVDYSPQKRMKMKLGSNITTLDKTMGKSSDEIVTIYRGVPTGSNGIVGGDYVTTNKQLAKDYSGTGIVVEKKVKLSDILDDKADPLGEEYIYRPQPVERKAEYPDLAPAEKAEAVKEQGKTIEANLKPGKKVIVYKNPTDAQAQELRSRFKEEYPNAMRGEPKTRSSYDKDGNEYRWMSGDATHPMVENYVKDKFGVETNQNKYIIEAKPQPIALPAEKPSEAATEDFKGKGIGKVAPETRIAQVPTESLSIDATKFQFKRFLGKGGVSSTLKSIKKYNPELGGIISVWKDPVDNKTYIVNGHHRYELAQRTGQKDLTVRYLEATNAQEAKLKGALINIAEGQGTPEDAAIIFRQNDITPETIGEKYNISLKGDIAQEGMALSGLSPELFEKIEIGEFPRNWGVVIGEKLRNDFDAQNELAKLIKREGKKKHINTGIIEQVINDIQGVGKRTETQATLFGDEIKTRPLLIERGELRDYAINKLLSDKRLFGIVSKDEKAERLRKAGNIITPEENKKLSEEAGKLASVLNQLASHKGPINDTINEYAKELANAVDKTQKDIAKRNFFESVQNSIRQEITGIQKKVPERTEQHGKGREPRTGTPAEQIEGFKPKPKMFGGKELIPKTKPAKKAELAALDKIERKATSKFEQDSMFEPNQQDLFGKPKGGVSEGIYRVSEEALAEQYVPITRKEADNLFDKGAADLVARFNIRGAETTGEEGYYMRIPVQKEMKGYGTKQLRYTKEVLDSYEKYKKRHGGTESGISITKGDTDQQRGRLPSEVRKAKPEKPADVKARLIENIKSEKGESALINDLSILGADAIRKGHESFKAFSAQMKTVLSEVWDKVKHLMRQAYDAAKIVLKSERGAIGGIKAIGAPTGQLAKAQEMLKEGKSEKEVWKETGWLKGAEKKETWKWEIDDSGAKFKWDILLPRKEGLGRATELSEILKQPELFKNYPQLSNILTTVEIDRTQEPQGEYIPAANRSSEGLSDLEPEIKIIAKTTAKAEESIFHEIAHAIQEIEGFAPGGSEEQFRLKGIAGLTQNESTIYRNLMSDKIEYEGYISRRWLDESTEIISKKNFIEKNKTDKGIARALQELEDVENRMKKAPKTAFEAYRNLAGEIEARDTAARAKLTPEQRREQMPYESQGIPREDWIVTDGDGTSFSVEATKDDLTKKRTEFLKQHFPEMAIGYRKITNESDNVSDIISSKKSIRWSKEFKKDLNWFDTTLKTAEFYSEKDPTYKRYMDVIFNAKEKYFELQNQILGTFLDNSKELRREDKQFKTSKYQRLEDYLDKTDRFISGYSIKEVTTPFGDKGFEIYSQPVIGTVNNLAEAAKLKDKDSFVAPSGDKLIVFGKKELEGEYSSEEEALSDMVEHEIKDYVKQYGNASYSELETLRDARSATNEQFNLLTNQIRKMIAEKKDMEVIVGFEEGKPIKKNLSWVLAEMGNLRGSYMPRQRPQGKYALIAKKGEHDKIREHFDIPATEETSKLAKIGKYVIPMQRRADELTKKGYKITYKKIKSMPESVFEAAKLVAATDAMLKAGVEKIEVSPESERLNTELSNLVSEAISNLFKARGFRSQMIKRGGEIGDAVWKGHETNLDKRIIGSANSVSSGIAKRDKALGMMMTIMGRDISYKDFKEANPKATHTDYNKMVSERRIDPITQKNMYSDIMNHAQEVLRNDESIDRIVGTAKGVASFWFLAFRVSSAAINGSNMAVLVPATMHGIGKIPYHKTFGLIGSGIKTYINFRTGKKISASDNRVLTQVKKRGWDAAQFNQDAHEALLNKASGAWNKTISIGMWMFGKVEELNRGATILATFNGLDSKLSFEKRLEQAKHISDRAHGIYDKATRPKISRGTGLLPAAARSAVTFTKYTHTYLQDLLQLAKDEKSALAVGHMLLAPAIIGGLGSSLIAPVISAMAKALGFGGDDPEEEWYKYAEEQWGMGKWFRHGLVGLGGYGVNLKGSLSIGFPSFNSLESILGAPYAVPVNITKGISLAIKGDIAKGIEKAAPLFIGTPLRGLREATEGLTTRGGVPVFYGRKPVIGTPMEAMWSFMAFNPSRTSAIKEELWKERRVEQAFSERKSDIYKKYRKMWQDGITADKLGELAKETEQFNEEVETANNKGFVGITPITNKTLKVQKRKLAKPSKKEKKRDTDEATAYKPIKLTGGLKGINLRKAIQLTQ